MANEYLFKDKTCPSCKLPRIPGKKVIVIVKGKGICPRCKKPSEIVPVSE